MSRCAWPKSCDEVADVRMGLLWFCQDHAIEVDKNLNGTVDAHGKRVVGLLEQFHMNHRPNPARHARWLLLQEAQKRQLAEMGEEKKKVEVDTIGQFREGIVRHDKWRAEQAVLPRQESAVDG